MYLHLFAFLVIYIKSFGFCLFLFLHSWLFTLKLLVFVDCFATHCIKSSCIQSFSGPYFSAFGLNREIYKVNLRFQPGPEKQKIWTRKLRIRSLFTNWCCCFLVKVWKKRIIFQELRTVDTSSRRISNFFFLPLDHSVSITILNLSFHLPISFHKNQAVKKGLNAFQFCCLIRIGARNIHRKRPVLESLFNKDLLKKILNRDSIRGAFLWILQRF